jgi:hypothetical protein
MQVYGHHVIVPTGWSGTGKITIKQLGRRYNWTMHSILAQTSGLPAPYFMYRLPAGKAQAKHSKVYPAEECEGAKGENGNAGAGDISVVTSQSQGKTVSSVNCSQSTTAVHSGEHHHHLHKPRRDGVLGMYVVAITPAAAASITSHEEYRKGRPPFLLQSAWLPWKMLSVHHRPSLYGMPL